MKIDQPSATIYAFPMLSKAASATEEAGSVPVAAAEVAATAAKEPLYAFLGAARRDNLTADELASPGTLRYLISDLERLNDRCLGLEGVEKTYNDLRVEHARLEERANRSKWSSLLSDACLSIGSLALGAAPSYIGLPGAEKVGFVVIAGAAVLIISGIVAKWRG